MHFGMERLSRFATRKTYGSGRIKNYLYVATVKAERVGDKSEMKRAVATDEDCGLQ